MADRSHLTEPSHKFPSVASSASTYSPSRISALTTTKWSPASASLNRSEIGHISQAKPGDVPPAPPRPSRPVRGRPEPRTSAHVSRGITLQEVERDRPAPDGVRELLVGPRRLAVPRAVGDPDVASSVLREDEVERARAAEQLP